MCNSPNHSVSCTIQPFLSDTHTHTPTPPCMDQGSPHYCRFKQLLCSPVTHTVFPTTKGSHTSREWCNFTSFFLLYLHLSICHFRSSWQQFFLQYQHSPSVSLNELWEISLSHFYILEAVCLVWLYSHGEYSYYSSCSSSVSYSAALGDRESKVAIGC